MYLIAGLGNPGLKYRKTPHNGNGKVTEARIGGEKVLLVKPQTFMNLSGDCIAPLAAYYKIPSEHIAVCYDDKDLPMGKLRIRSEGSAGRKSIIARLDTQSFPRIRMGIGAPQGIRLMDYVLHKLSRQEQAVYAQMAQDAAQAAILLVREGLAAAQQKYSFKAH